MSLAVCKAFMYKSLSIYKTKYLASNFYILWPCLILLFTIWLKNYQPDNSTEESNEQPYFTDATFRNNVMSNYERNRLKRSAELADYSDDTNQELCAMQTSMFMIVCFIGLWSGAGFLAHAERMSGTVERMRMYGISDYYIVFSYIFDAGIKQLVSSLLCAIILKLNLGKPPLIEDTDLFSVFLILFLLNLHSTIYFLAVGSFFNSSNLRSVVATSSYIYLLFWALRQNFSVTAQFFGNMFAPFCTAITMKETCAFEQNGGVSLNSLISATTDINDLPLLVVLVLMIFGSTLMMFLFFYLLNVRPGPYGSARPIYFIIPEKLLSLLGTRRFGGSKNETEKNFREGLFEKVSENIKIGIKIENIYKKFGNITSVKNLSLNIYSGQITALLGHNGAGKTTTLSILAGMLSPTSGSAFFQGYNIFQNLRQFRRNLGLCPQSNLLHPTLLVINQLIFFGMLGGLSMKEAEESANNLLKMVGIYEKKHVAIKQLSGGMQRKLCIALALVGKPKVLILDEPTSGVDPESRREIWNVLLEAREERVVLITTHFMEEADALGDQIAIMNHGEIVCYGSPMFLKKHYGAGYHVTVSCASENFARITQTITAKIPDTVVIGEHEEWIKYKLPFNEVKDFPELFQALESDGEVFRIGISCTTMEDVYLKVEEEAGGEMSSVPKPSGQRVQQTGEGRNITTYFNRFLGLVTKNILYTRRKWLKTIFIVVLVPIVSSYITLNEYNTDFSTYINNKTDIVTSENGLIMNEENSYNLDTKSAYLTKEITRIEKSEEYYADKIECNPDPYKKIRVTIFSTWMSYTIFVVSSKFSSFVLKEKISSVKHIILMSGLSPVIYWLSVFLWDMIVYLVFCILSLITLLITDSSNLLGGASEIYILFLILLLSGISMISSVYFITLLFNTSRLISLIYFAGVLTIGIISFLVVEVKYFEPYSHVLRLQPLPTTLSAMYHFIMKATEKSDCRKCPYKDCNEILSTSYLADEHLRGDLMFLCLDFLLFMLLVILKDYGVFPYIWNKIKSVYIGRIDNTGLKDVDTDVAREKDKVDTSHYTTDVGREPLVIVDGLAKKYSRSMTAVYDVTFAVSKGECFGLLGVNGAGKSTTFNMLTGMFYPTEGNMFLKGYSLKNNKTKCLSHIGYCPQHSALSESLTAREMLNLFAKLRLIPSQDVEKEVNKWITLFGLDEYCDRCCGTYSGGNKRKLSAALAFIGDPSLVLLDEPTSGVDPFIRRNLWDIIHACGRTNQAIIISSHSMDECETVCDRLTIMAKGRMECIGNTQHLKSQYGTGYVIKITLKAHNEGELMALKSKMQATFSSWCELKDEHQVLLHYHLGTNIYKPSQLFIIMEHMKREFTIVDDYIITDSSLEEVFLSFAKSQNQ